MKKIILLLCLFHISLIYSQETVDTIQSNLIEQVIVIGNKRNNYQKEDKPLSTLGENLGNSNKINLIRRGAYAWEAYINSMSTERTSITIDGMRIFSACIDKMDPVTSYVETSNLKEFKLHSGMQGGIHSGNNIGGSLDFMLNKAGFKKNNGMAP